MRWNGIARAAAATLATVLIATAQVDPQWRNREQQQPPATQQTEQAQT